MARQPFLPTYTNRSYAVGALVLRDRPELTSRIGRCIAIWAQVDNEIGNLFAILLGTASDAALEVFLSLRRAASQRDSLAAAAKFKLRGEDLETFDALLKVYGSLENQRNALAHGCFGICDDDPSLLLWIDIRDHVHFQAEVLAKELRGEQLPDPHERLKKNMYVYRLADLDRLYEDMEQFWWAAFYFNGYLRRPNEPGRKVELQKVREFSQVKAALKE
jgi:hypothetical protein